MSDQLFPILGDRIAPMLGRRKIMERLWSDLTKATPSNLSMVGPRFVGKTVIMNALAERIAREDSPFEFVLHWHLGRVAPSSDAEFVAQLCDLLRQQLAKAGSGYEEHLKYLDSHFFAELKEVTDSLDGDGKAILILWDGFDKPLGQGKLTGQLWDQMRSIFYGTRHKIVTATRAPLSSLIRSDDAITSPFWNIFDMSPVRVQSFDDEDRENVLKLMSSHTFAAGAKTQLLNWSGGFPPLFLEILNQVAATSASGYVIDESVNAAAENAVASLGDVVLNPLWDDCPANSKDLFIHLMSRGELKIVEVGNEERACLLEKGFARLSGNKLHASCRLLQEHVDGAAPDAGSMARLFGDWDDYQGNIRGLLERRLGHISRFDKRLYRLIARAIEDIPDFPDDCLNNLTSVEDRALDMIWEREFGASRTIPKEIVNYWTGHPRCKDSLVKDFPEVGDWTVPASRGKQIGFLQLLTGSKEHFESKARACSKDTYVLLNAIHSYRNRGEHKDGESLHVGVAVAAIITCLELLSCLDREQPA